MQYCQLCGQEIDCEKELGDAGGNTKGLEVQCPGCGVWYQIEVEMMAEFRLTLKPIRQL